MTLEQEQYQSLVKLLLPEEIFNYFEFINIEVIENKIHVYLDEENTPPEGYKKEKLITKGFHPAITIQDFPIRDKPLYLHIRRRRWLIENTGQYVSRNWDSVAKGTRMTKDFATFLKGLLG